MFTDNSMTRRQFVAGTSSVLLAVAVPAAADDWPQWLGPGRDGVWRETGIVKKLPAELTYKWRTPIGEGYAGPAVVGNRVFVADRQFERGQSNNLDDPYNKSPIGGIERVLCLAADTGKVLWRHEYPCRYTISFATGPRATPTVHEDKLYSVGAMGDLFCLDAASGEALWSKNYIKDYGTRINPWGMVAAPLIDGDNVILLVGGADNACVVALDKDTGKEVWRSLDAKDPGYCAPVIYKAGGKRQLIIWTPDALYSLDPHTGDVYWQQPFRIKAGLSIAEPIFDPQRNLLLVSSFYNGPMMMKLAPDRPAARVLWKGKSNSELPRNTDGLHALFVTPVFDDGYIYGICSYGQLRCLEAETGERIWETFEATGGRARWRSAFLIKHKDRYFLCNDQGDLIIARLSPAGYEELSRAPLIEPTSRAFRRPVVWSHPAFANRCIYARNDKEIVCVDLSAD